MTNETNNSADHLASAGGVEAAWLQHARDSAELRRLCQARDDARRERDEARAALTAQSGEGVALLDELRNIANAKPEQWDPEMRGQFREWAQNRARAAIAAYEAKRGGAV